MCAINTRRGTPIPVHKCFHNWSGSSCSVEADNILHRFQQSEQLHGVQYTSGLFVMKLAQFTTLLFMGFHHTGIAIKKVECENHAVKCYRNRLEGVCIEKLCHQGCTVLQGDVAALHHDLWNGPCRVPLLWIAQPVQLNIL